MYDSRLKTNSSGAVALITVILLMFIFIIVILGFLRLALNEQRQASDNDLNTRAYYAAESGVEDAKRILSQFSSDGNISNAENANLNGDECIPASATGSPQPVLSQELDTEITCQLIDLTPGDFVSSLNIYESAFIPLIPEGGEQVSRVMIEWHETQKDGAVASRANSNTSLPIIGCWHTNETNDDCETNQGTPYSAMLRAGLFTLPANGAITRGSFTNRISYLNPINSVGVTNVGSFETKSNGNTINRISSAPRCRDSGGTYFCELTITGLSGQNYLRLTSLYRGTTVRVTMLDNDNQVLDFADTQAKIDVTAKAGDVVRRIETRVPLRSVDILPDEAITTADQLCKKINIETVDAGGVALVRRGNDQCPQP